MSDENKLGSSIKRLGEHPTGMKVENGLVYRWDNDRQMWIPVRRATKEEQ